MHGTHDQFDHAINYARCAAIFCLILLLDGFSILRRITGACPPCNYGRPPSSCQALKIAPPLRTIPSRNRPPSNAVARARRSVADFARRAARHPRAPARERHLNVEGGEPIKIARVFRRGYDIGHKLAQTGRASRARRAIERSSRRRRLQQGRRRRSSWPAGRPSPPHRPPLC